MAVLVPQLVEIPLAVGVNTKIDRKLLESGKLEVAENIVLTKAGRASKRNGYAERPRSIFGGSSIAAGDALDVFGDELLLFDGPAMYSWAAGVAMWQSKGFIVPTVASGRSLARSMDRQRSVPSADTLAGQTVTAYEDSTGGVRATVVDDATGNILQSDVLMNSGGANPKVVAFESPQVIAVIYRATNDLCCQFYTPSAGTFGGELTITNDAHGTAQIDAIPALGKCVVAYRTTGPILKLAVLLETGAFASSGYPSAITINEDPTNAICVYWDSATRQFWLFWHNSEGVRGARRYEDFTNAMPTFEFDPADVDDTADTITEAGNALAGNTLVWFSNSGGALPTGLSTSTNYYVIAGDPDFQVSASAGPGSAVDMTDTGTGTHTLTVLATTVEDLADIRNITAARVSDTQVRVFYEQSAAQTYNYLVRANTFTSTGVPGTAAVLKRSVGLRSKAFIYNGTQYVALAHESTLQSTYFVADSDGNLIAKLLPLVAGGLTAKASSLSAARVDAAGTTFRFAAQARQRLVSEGDDVFTLKGIWDCELRFTDPVLHLGAPLGQNLHIVGGALWAYDGNAPVEHGFHLFPENLSAAQSTSGSLTQLATYGYAAVYEWVDAKGQLHRSAAGYLSVTLTGANDDVTLTIPTLRLTAKSGVSIAIYRTEADGTVYYRISSIASPKLNDPTADTVTYADTAADSAIIGNEQLYTNGDPAVLENDGPPACSLIAVGKERVWLGGLEVPNVAWFSKQRADGLGIAFSAFFAVQLEAEGGAETAIATMDDKVVFFKRSRIYYTAGEGPDDTGGANYFAKPILVTADAGCVDSNSVVATPVGLMFKSAKGYYLLDRSLQVSYVGAPIEAYNDQTCKAATLKDGTNQVVFKVDRADDGTTALVYDYFWDQWYTETQTEAVDAIVWGGTYHYLRSDGKVRYETPGVFLDVSTHIPPRLRSPIIKTAGISGYQRVKRFAILGEYASPHRLQAKIAYDNRRYFEDTLTLVSSEWMNTSTYGSGDPEGADDPYGGAGDGVAWLRGDFPVQQCGAVQLEITEAADGAPGEGMSFSVLSLLVAVKQGLRRQPVEKEMS